MSAMYEELYRRCYAALGTEDEARVGPPLDVKIRLLRDELDAIDDALYDASADMGDAEHQIAMHEATLPEFVRALVKHLKRIDAVGAARREKLIDELEAHAKRCTAPRINAELPEETRLATFTFEPALNFKNRQELLKHLKKWCIENLDRHLMSYEFK